MSKDYRAFASEGQGRAPRAWAQVSPSPSAPRPLSSGEPRNSKDVALGRVSLALDSLFPPPPTPALLRAVNPHFPSTSPNPVSKLRLACHLLQEAFLGLYVIVPACDITRSLLFSCLLCIPTQRPLGDVCVRAHTHAHTHSQACTYACGGFFSNPSTC